MAVINITKGSGAFLSVCKVVVGRKSMGVRDLSALRINHVAVNPVILPPRSCFSGDPGADGPVGRDSEAGRDL